jgi:hypothetical protein
LGVYANVCFAYILVGGQFNQNYADEIQLAKTILKIKSRSYELRKMNHLKIIILLLYSILSNGQENYSELKNQLSEIKNYTKFIDSTSKEHKEGIAEGPIIYKNLFRKNGGWDAYYLSDNGNNPLRIKYSQTGFKTVETYKLYYKNSELIYAEFVEEYLNKKIKTSQTRFYFQNGNLINQTDIETSNLDLNELLREEKRIKEYYYKK